MGSGASGILALVREISLRHWARSPLRSLLVVVGISLSVALYVATQTATQSILSSFDEFVQRVSGRADLTVENAAGVRSELVPTIAELPGVAHAASTLEISAQAPELNESVMVLGVDLLGDLHFLPFVVTEGEQRVVEDPLAFVNDPTAILISERFAKRHRLVKDSRVKLLTTEGPKDFFVRGVLQDSGPASSFGGQVAVMFQDAAQVSFGRGTLVDRIDVAIAPGANIDAVRAEIQKVVDAGISVERPAQIGMRLRKLIMPLHGGLLLSSFLALLVGGFLVYNAVGVAVAQRRRELGVLRALGVTQGGTVALFTAEAAILALPGIALGLIAGRLLSNYSTEQAVGTVNLLYSSVSRTEPKLSLSVALEATAAGLGTAVLAAWWPARRGARVDPAIILRGSSAVESSSMPVIPLLVAGVLLTLLAWLPGLTESRFGRLLAMTATLVGCSLATPAMIIGIWRAVVRVTDRWAGVPARLGLDYVVRTLGRSAVNVLALTVAVSMSVSVGGWLRSFESSVQRWIDHMTIPNLSVTQGSPVLDRRHVPMSPASVDRVERLPGVQRVSRMRMVDQPVAGRDMRIIALDFDAVLTSAAERDRAAFTVVQGPPLVAAELEREPQLLISENAATLLGVSVGDTVNVPTPTGEAAFKVRSVIVDYSSDKGTLVMDSRHFVERWKKDAVNHFAVYAEPGANIESITNAIRAELGGFGVFVTKTEALRTQLISAVRSTFAYSKAVELVTLLVALMGVIGTMAAAILDRMREIGMIRAIGATSRQVATSIVVEAAFLGFCAAVIGVAAGIVQCKLFLSTILATATGWHFELSVPWEAATRIGLLVIATSALAGGLPAWRAARSSVSGAVASQ